MPLLRKRGKIIGVLTVTMAVVRIFIVLAHKKVHSQLEVTLMEQNLADDKLGKDKTVLGRQLWLGLSLGIAVITVICAILLIHAVQKQRRHLMKPYLISEGILCIILVVGCFYEIYVAVKSPDAEQVAAGFAFVFFVVFLIQFYLWLSAFSLFQSMREQSDGPEYN